MKKYKCIKIVEAEPQEKDGQPGYKVKYEEGYISWSPKEAFEKGYVDHDTYKERLSYEYKEITLKCAKLKNAIDSGKVKPGQFNLMNIQLLTMDTYRHILLTRISSDESFSEEEVEEIASFGVQSVKGVI